MNVLSLFDGISCGQVALQRAGVKVTSYFASEIDKYCIKITQDRHPATIQLGDVKTVTSSTLPKIDLLIGGSPCQGFSFAGKQLNFNDPRSALFFEFVRLLETCKPKYFLLENVRMKKEYAKAISGRLGVEPIIIDSNLVSAQNRLRYYWTNIPNITQPEDKNILLKDILESDPDNKYHSRGKHKEWFIKNMSYQLGKKYSAINPVKAIPLLARQYASWNGNFISNIDSDKFKKYIIPSEKTLTILDQEVQKRKIGFFGKDSQGNRVYSIHGKAVTLTGEAGGLGAKTGLYLFGCITPDKIVKRQNGQRFNEGNKSYTLPASDKHGVLMDGYIRKLTPVECERLQTLPDNYTEGISDNQRYKALGNGWTVDVIAHIFKNIPTN